MKEGLELSNTVLVLLAMFGAGILFIWRTGQGEAKKDTQIEAKLTAFSKDIGHLKKSSIRRARENEAIKIIIDNKNEKILFEIKELENTFKEQIKHELQSVDKKIATTETLLKDQLKKMEVNIEKLTNQNNDALLVLRIIEDRLKTPNEKPF